MEDKTIKAFGDFEELTKEQQIRFKGFECLNKLVISYIELYESYVKVVLDIGKNDIDFSSYTELDYQVKYLIEVVKIPINRILDFAEIKFVSIKYILQILRIFPNSNINKGNFLEIAREMLKLKNGTFEILIGEKIGSNDFTTIAKIDFDISNIKLFEKKLLEINFSFEENDNIKVKIGTTVIDIY